MAKSFPNTGVTIIDSVSDLPGSPVEGLMVFQKDSNELKIFDGSSWVSVVDTDTPPALVKITSGAFNNSSEVIVDDCFSSLFTNYRLLFTINSCTVNGPYGQFNFRTTGGNYNSANYYHAHRGVRSDNTTFDTAVTANTQFDYIGNADDTIYPSTGSIDIYSPFLSTERTSLTYHGATVEATKYDMIIYSGWVIANTSFSGFRLKQSSGNITGRYVLYGYRD